MSIDIIPPDPSLSPATSNNHLSPQSRAQSRKKRHLSNHATTTTAVKIAKTTPSRPSSTTTPAPSTFFISSNPYETAAPLHPSSMAPPTATIRLLIASIGNPAPYLSTLHSAGHTALHSLSRALDLPLTKGPRAWSHGLLAPSERYTLWASPTLMNASGAAVATAWRTFSAQAGEEARLVVLHDELEAPLGAVKVRMGTASAKGHNGLKSIGERMPGVEYVRIGIGIGRPESREPGAVAAYVLRKMSVGEKAAIERAAVGGVLGELRRLSGE